MKNNITIGVVSAVVVALAAYGDPITYTCNDTESIPCYKGHDDREASYDCPGCFIGDITFDGNPIDQCYGVNDSLNIGCVNEAPTTCTYESDFYNDNEKIVVTYPSSTVTPTKSADGGNCS